MRQSDAQHLFFCFLWSAFTEMGLRLCMETDCSVMLSNQKVIFCYLKKLHCARCFSSLILMAVCIVTEAPLVRSPVNTAVTRGSTVTMSCSSDVTNAVIKWYNSLCGSYDVPNECKRQSLIYNGYNNNHNPPRFSVTSGHTSHVTRDLNINSTQLTDAGVYVCVENIPGYSVQHTSSTQLIVVGNTYNYDFFLNLQSV